MSLDRIILKLAWKRQEARRYHDGPCIGGFLNDGSYNFLFEDRKPVYIPPYKQNKTTYKRKSNS